MESDEARLTAAISCAVEPVGKEAFGVIYKALSDGLPPKEKNLQREWYSDVHAGSVTNMLPTSDEEPIAFLALQVERSAKNALISLFLNKEFREMLKRDFQIGQSQKMTEKRVTQRTNPFKQALIREPDKTTKELVTQMERDGAIVDEGDSYSIKAAGNGRIAKSSIDSKFSRLRTKLQNA